ncbi:anaerobic ribonucleoside-triphosphate reductase activating protein [uncultured Cohaesibacter sp.]|uniref:anaerobic ribonucleoside-triphosphate reductase activating protein n=1 Tax=uncultured Cohaesibacter sp. TaxID=1002546 RepID=UPI00292F3BEF|nr:anaerobic ribonucleoside-triphosphate reductase activating protein [uncultured Cohaesibacter sp.]
MPEFYRGSGEQGEAANLRIGGFEPISFCDWPGEIVATIFCQGCPWRCPYCHNPALIPSNVRGKHNWEEVVTFLENRRGLIDGVVFSGGEPTLQAGLATAIKCVRGMGFRIGLHTGGPYPKRFAKILPFLDWVGFDIKASQCDYEKITCAKGSGPKAFESLALLQDSGVDFELRTTVHQDLLTDSMLEKLERELHALGYSNLKLQKFRPDGVDQERLNKAINQTA